MLLRIFFNNLKYGVLHGKRESCLDANMSCLCLCTEQQFGVSDLLRVSEQGPRNNAASGFYGPAGGQSRAWLRLCSAGEDNS